MCGLLGFSCQVRHWVGCPGFPGVSRHSQWVPALGARVPDNFWGECEDRPQYLWPSTWPVLDPHLHHTEQGGEGVALDSSAAKGGREQELVPSQSPLPAWTSRPPEPRGSPGQDTAGHRETEGPSWFWRCFWASVASDFSYCLSSSWTGPSGHVFISLLVWDLRKTLLG